MRSWQVGSSLQHRLEASTCCRQVIVVCLTFVPCLHRISPTGSLEPKQEEIAVLRCISAGALLTCGQILIGCVGRLFHDSPGHFDADDPNHRKHCTNHDECQD